MYGLGYISPSVVDLITPPANDLTGYGDMYVITDTRKRPRKDLTNTKAFERFDIREFNSSEISRLQSEDPLLFEQIKAYFEDGTLGSIRKEKPPRKTGIGYKVFVLKKGKLYPPMVANPNGEDTPVGVWLDADAAPIVSKSKTGRPQVKAGGKGTQGGSGTLAYRPGWHLGVIPYAIQFNRKDENGQRTLFPKNFVWAEVEYAADINYQKEAEAEGYTKNGKYNHAYAGLKYLPKNGYYIYRTNPDPNTDPWIITGAMKVNRILSNAEVDALVKKAGRKPQRRESDATLGKPNIKLEFNTNEELANFLTENRKSSAFDNYVDVTATESGTAADRAAATREKIKRAAILPGSGSKTLPGTMSPTPLAPTKTPPPLPPSEAAKSLPTASTAPTVPPLPSFDTAFKDADKIHDPSWFQHGFKMGDYGYVDDLMYLDIYIPKYYAVGDNLMKFAEHVFPNFVIVICFVNSENKWVFYFNAKKYGDFIKRYYPKNTLDVSYTGQFVVVRSIDVAKQLIKHFEENGMQVALLRRNIYKGDQPEIITRPKTALPPYVEPTTPTASTSTPSDETPPTPTSTPSDETPEVTAESVTDEEIDTTNQSPVSVDFDALQKRLYNASYWSSFDPDRAAASDVASIKSDYNTYAAEVPDGYENAFNAFFNKLSNNIISLKSKTANAAVTGSGGVSARKAERLNRNFDAYMQAWRNFDTELERYVNKLKRRAKRREFLSKSLDERSDDRINELKEDIDKIASSMAALKAKDDSVLNLDFYRRHWPEWTEKMIYDTAVGRYRDAIAQAKQTLFKKVENEYYKGHQRTVNAVVDYVRERGIYTPNSKIFGYYKEIQESEPNAANDGTKFQGAEILANEHLDRLQIKFDGKPSEEVRNDLKKRGFRWSPHYGVWQRQLTNDAMWEAKRILNEHFTPASLGKPTIHLEFENNDDLMRLFDTSDISGIEEQPAEIFNCPESMLQCQGFSPTYKILPSYDHLIDHATGQRTLVGYGFEKATLQELIDACRYYPQVAKLADHLKDPDGNELQSAFNIWHFMHTNVRYNYDAPGTEEIRVPARTWLDRYSGVDCDCLSVFTACLLICMGYRPMFEIVAFDHKPQYSHIFVNLNGAAIDRVLPAFLQRPAAITKTKIMDIPVYRLSGCNLSAVNALNGLFATTLQKLNDGTATADDSIDFRKAQILISLQGCDYNAYRLAGVLMPFVATIGDDGVYYFTNSEIARIAEQADSELRDLSANHADGDRLNGWFDTVIKKVNRAASPDVATIRHTDNAPTIVVIVNPRANRVAAQGHRANVVKINPLVVLTRNCIRLLLSINYLGMASRFAVGLMSEDVAEAAGYSDATWHKAVAAVDKLRALYSQLAGDDSDITNSIIIGAQKQALYEGDYKPSQLIVETSPFDAVLSGNAEGVQIGVNGLGNGITVGSAIATVGALLPVIWGWIADVVPTTTPTTSTETAALAPAEDAEESDILPWLLLGIGGIVGGAAVISNNKKKPTKKRK